VEQHDKVRECDDFTKDGEHVNAGVRCWRQLKLDGIDAVLSVALELCNDAGTIPPEQLLLWKRDHASAYRQVPLLAAHQHLAVVTFCHPDTGKHVFFVHQALPFGAVAAVVGYNRISRAITFLARKMFALPMISYYDDFIGVDLGSNACLGFVAFGELNRVLEFELKWRKDVWPDGRAPVLGLSTVLARLPFRVEVTPDRCAKLRSVLQSFLDTEVVSPAQAGKIAGRLRFAQAGVFGGVGRAAIQPFYRRQRAPSGCSRLSRGLREARDFWLRLLAKPPARRIFHPAKRAGGGPRRMLYTDASGAGYICGVLFTDGPWRPKVYSFRIPRDVRRALFRRKNQIALYEAMAAVVATYVFAPWLRDTEVILFIDNQSAEGFLRNGYARGVAQDASRLASLWWERCARIRLSPWLEWVPSLLNISDGPTRPEEPGKCDELLALQPEWMRWGTSEFPPEIRHVLAHLF